MKETTITNKVLKEINALPRAKALKRHGSVFGKAGEPDIDASIGGRSVQIEMKVPGERPTDLQTKRLAEWAASGAVAFWATSWAEVRARLVAEGLMGGGR
jgi:hypothetical protein